jgi:U3 small nucleolar RNA-associated protein 25
MDDDFKLGIQINPGQGKGTGADRGAYLRMYCDFFQSDIIVASPLGLRLLIEKNGSGGGGKLNADFLSSVEIAILHQSDVMYMQNWEHVEYIMQRTNKLAESDRGTDFSRIRPYFLEGKGAEHRQLILTTQFNDPIIQASFRAHGQSVAGAYSLSFCFSTHFYVLTATLSAHCNDDSYCSLSFIFKAACV